ncbi:MAG: trimethylamine methyltransferase family protein [Gammaproteobacteria bacterium]|nr:methyltransferase [Gammaproteobacteria bacterium]MDG2434712.1 trimethylamine methyltransferase family protein [Gammaproteobacteria bacterium]
MSRRSTKRSKNIAAEVVKPVVEKGMLGGKYKPLSDHDIEQIHQTTLDVLENIGMGNPLPQLKEAALKKGCTFTDQGRLLFPRSLVEDVIARAGRDFIFYGRDSKHDMEMSDKKVHIYGGGEAVTVLDLGAKKYRPSTINDVYDIARLVDYLDNIHSYSRLVVATEFTDLLKTDINTAYASVQGTSKHTALTFADASHVEPTIEMLDIIAGGNGNFLKRPFCHGGGCTVVSPLRYGTDNCEVAIESIKFNAPVWVVIAPQSGATSPAALAGSLVQVLAETLASLMLIDLIKPGHPVIFGPWPFVTDLRTGSFSGGSGEEALMAAAAAQITNHYGLVSSVGAGMTDSKSPDAQAGYEKGITIAMAALAGCNNVSESSGMMASLMGVSYESLVIDNDMIGMILRAVRGIEVNEETLSYQEIKNTVEGEGHFLRDPQTLSLMKTEYLYPELADRSTQDVWESEGSPDMRERAEKRARKILNSHYPVYIDSKIDKKIRASFPIEIPENIIKPKNIRF